ncbi:AbgT family transporter [Anaerococcus urinomassiliensis]|uniref:AbgT family transporter n=1 Tax=Anaerococcus urinomassiliensis TaxID=1745712 RepID=UPI000938A4AC|nr:AbgT family transporter [Anaerococcus urinomassiliensis]
MPHIIYIVLGLLILMSLLTYVIPAGNFAVDGNGNIDASNFNYLGHQTPVSFKDLFFMLAGGLAAASATIWVVMISGANMEVVLDTGAIDNTLNYATIKLRDKSTKVLIPALYFLILILASFASTDALIAVVPIGVLFAKKLKLDPIAALSVSFFPSVIGFGLGITIRVIPVQALFDLPMLSGFGMRFVILLIFGIVGYLFTRSYVNKITKDPTKSLMYDTGWSPESEEIIEEEVNVNVEAPVRSFVVLALLIIQYLLLVVYILKVGDRPMDFMLSFFLVYTFILGLVGGMKLNEIAVSMTKGISKMALVGLIIGFATSMQTIMVQGNIIDSIVYNVTRPLMGLNRSLSAVGITIIITILNPIIPSAMAKAAALIPIVSPIASALDIHNQVALQAFLFGDSFTNIISPALGWTMGALAIAGVPYSKWVKWVVKPVLVFILLSCIVVYVLNSIGWTGM